MKKRILSLILAALLIVTALGITSVTVSAAPTGTLLTVTDARDGSQRTFTYDDLTNIAASEGSKTYSYTAMSTFPSYTTFDSAKGPTLRALFAGFDTIERDTLLRFTASDGRSSCLTADELLFRTRYNYPSFKLNPTDGSAPSAGSLEGAYAVPAIIDISGITDDGSGDEGVLRFGQISPTELTTNDFVKYLCNGGSITILDESADEFDEAVSAEPSTGLRIGDSVTITPPVTADMSSVRMYYTTDGSEPDEFSEMYNFSNWGKGPRKPAITKEGTTTLKVALIGRSGERSDTAVFPLSTYQIATPVLTAENETVNCIELDWVSVPDATGYVIMRALKGSGKWVNIKNTGASTTEFRDTTVKPGAWYYYRIKAVNIKTGDQSPYCKSVTICARPAAPDDLSLVRKSATGSRPYIKIDWDSVDNITKYRVVRYEAGSGADWKGMTLTTSTAFTDYNVKRGKTYYYRVYAYKTVNKVNIFSLSSNRLDIVLK